MADCEGHDLAVIVGELRQLIVTGILMGSPGSSSAGDAGRIEDRGRLWAATHRPDPDCCVPAAGHREGGRVRDT